MLGRLRRRLDEYQVFSPTPASQAQPRARSPGIDAKSRTPGRRQIPLAARHAREVKCDLQKQYGNLADPRTESVLTAIGIAFKALKKLFGGE